MLPISSNLPTAKKKKTGLNLSYALKTHTSRHHKKDDTERKGMTLHL